MKAIHYDTEGDILSVTFTETGEQPHTGVELVDNIVLTTTLKRSSRSS
jgi:uncharacterized protein YuzE